ncbi:MAG: GNAT family N-acetyltransferase, partial [Planctomycetota bacterium]
MQTTIQVRFADAADYATLAEVMFDAVRHGPSRYSEAQRRAWVPMVRSGEQWERRLATQQVFVASQSTQTLGFISLAAKGYVDFAYVQPSAQRMGVFRRLYESLERFA